jgi:hypothetical protein
MKNKKILILSSLFSLMLTSCGGLSGSSTAASTTSSSSENASRESTSALASSSSEKLTLLIAVKYPRLGLLHSDVQLESVVSLPAQKKQVVWASSSPEVATVEGGLLHLVGLGQTLISASIGEAKDSFTLEVIGAILQGKILDYSSKPVVGASLSSGGRSALSGEDGTYALKFDGSEGDTKLTISKEGFTSLEEDLKDVLQQNEIVMKDYLLFSENTETILSLKGNLKNVKAGALAGASVRMGEAMTTSAADGSFLLENAKISSKSHLDISLEGFVSLSKDVSLSSVAEQVKTGAKIIDLGNYELYQSQTPIAIYTSANHHVQGQIYRGLDALHLSFDADFDTSANAFFYELFFDFGSSKPSDYDRSDSRDCDFTIYSDGIRSKQKYNGEFPDTVLPFQRVYDGSHDHTEFSLPYAYLGMEKDEIFGFNVISHDNGVSDRSMALFGNFVEWYNYYTYPRLGLDNVVFQSNLNVDPFDFSKTGMLASEELGIVGTGEDYRYGISLKKDEGGLYFVLAKKNLTKPFVLDGTYDHLFIDTAQSAFTRATDSQILHFSLESGRWVTRYTIANANSVFNDAKGMPDLLNLGIVYSSREGVSVLYVPYAVFGATFSSASTLGLAANVEEGGRNWKSWQAPYISGYSSAPHVEEPASFVRLDKDLKVLK